VEDIGLMKLKLDENLSRHLKQLLALEGHDASTVMDEDLQGKPDVAVEAAARSEGRMLLTLDVQFVDLRVFRPGEHPGIVLFRPRTRGALAVTQFVLEFVRSTDLSPFAGCVTVVEPGRIRLRRPKE
jgi:predicted nuclease of predicted toxin-antitoxin system